ncbi:ABC transporter substrate-binding protein [Sphaerisporangium melleum]|uniref:ABC transporter substrate-binding protein n=1 Tax=Sphaerisporangium melleum TaxID=321316 RepID=A0A917VU96_9ACTN|nr:extracellular solute-binding protein [Sphaerisporangium melleum]GGL18331.1 ABC transporter substrate-binding protein [Sphaerisporangium melleum]GII74755.1 ABC transporter substrate-binding protein [Sphaerisporangium melleum]
MKFRNVSTVAVAVAAALTMAACSGTSGGTSSAGSDGKSFEFWSFTGINQKQSVTQYQQKKPDVQVKLTEVGNAQETAQALTTALAGGKVPDLVLIQGDDLPKFVQQPQNFVDLRTLGADKMKGDYLDWVISQAVTKDGTIIGIPTDVGGMAIAYRTDLFKAAGLPTDREEVAKLWPTWDAFIETGKKYTAATDKAFIDNAATGVFSQVVNQGSEKYYDPAGNAVYDRSPQVKLAFDLGIKAVTAGITAKQSSFTDGWSAAMKKGDYAAVAAPSWMLGSIRDNAPDTKGKWDIATIPGGAGNWGGSYLAIPARAKNPKAAWDYIATNLSPQGLLEHFLDAGSLPPTPSVYKDPKLTSVKDPFFSDAPIGTIYTDSLLGLKPFLIGPDSVAIGTEFLNAITNVEQGKGDPAKAWDAALANIKTAIGG